jgi:hypothetical protein
LADHRELDVLDAIVAALADGGVPASLGGQLSPDQGWETHVRVMPGAAVREQDQALRDVQVRLEAHVDLCVASTEATWVGDLYALRLSVQRSLTANHDLDLPGVHQCDWMRADAPLVQADSTRTLVQQRHTWMVWYEHDAEDPA